MTVKRAEFDRIISKLTMKVRQSGDLLVFYEYEGKVIVRSRRSNKQGDLPMPHAIRQQFKLNEDQFRDLVNCPLDRDGYVAILREKGLLEKHAPVIDVGRSTRVSDPLDVPRDDTGPLPEPTILAPSSVGRTMTTDRRP